MISTSRTFYAKYILYRDRAYSVLLIYASIRGTCCFFQLPCMYVSFSALEAVDRRMIERKKMSGTRQEEGRLEPTIIFT